MSGKRPSFRRDAGTEGGRSRRDGESPTTSSRPRGKDHDATRPGLAGGATERSAPEKAPEEGLPLFLRRGVSAVRPGAIHSSGAAEAVVKPAASSVFQARLADGRREDPLEQEADAVADRVVGGRGPSAPSGAQAASAAAVPIAGPGAPLPATVREKVEPVLGTSLGDVRVHDGPEAHAAARRLNARAFTHGRDVWVGAGQGRPETREGLHLLAHELTHVVQHRRSGATVVSRAPAPADKGTEFDEAKWFELFERSVAFAFTKYDLTTADVPIERVEDVEDVDDKVSPAHYDPDSRRIFYSRSGWRAVWDDYVVTRKIWTPDRYRDVVIDTALHEAFHAYQDTPRHKSKAFKAFEETVRPKLFSTFVEYVELGVVDTYDEFKTSAVPALTREHLTEERITLFMGDLPRAKTRDPKWRLSAREEVMNQWLHILNDAFFSARGFVELMRASRRRIGIDRGKPDLPEIEKHEVAFTELQAEKVGRLGTTEVKIWLKTRELEEEKDPAKQAELRREIALLTPAADFGKIPVLQAKEKELHATLKRLGESPSDRARAKDIERELEKIAAELDPLVRLRTGVEAVLRRRDLLPEWPDL